MTPPKSTMKHVLENVELQAGNLINGKKFYSRSDMKCLQHDQFCHVNVD
ncbi:hypothetical protein [uncultured Methanobrevibacter sp.]|nr:hypothetical protein [uncultured Methanobrevibacter sp.]